MARLVRAIFVWRKCVRDRGDAGMQFCDLPALLPGAIGRLMLTVMAAVAKFEAGRISKPPTPFGRMML